MNTKHTTGPWKVTEVMLQGRKFPTYYVQTPECASFQRIAETQHEATARLIAAAPDLLEALEAAYSVLMDCKPDADCDTYKREARQKARAAIAKATGETI